MNEVGMNHFVFYQHKIEQHKNNLLKKYPIKNIGFFGSVVRNDFTDNSDIDMIVEFTKPVGIEFIELAYELETILERRVDLISKKGLKPTTFDYIKEEIKYV